MLTHERAAFASKLWIWKADDGRECGPVSLGQLTDLYDKETVNDDTMVRAVGTVEKECKISQQRRLKSYLDVKARNKRLDLRSRGITIGVLNELGLKWRNVGRDGPTAGTDLSAPGELSEPQQEHLCAQLQAKDAAAAERTTLAFSPPLQFTQEEWDACQIRHLSGDHFIKAGEFYYQPVVSRRATVGSTGWHSLHQDKDALDNTFPKQGTSQKVSMREDQSSGSHEEEDPVIKMQDKANGQVEGSIESGAEAIAEGTGMDEAFEDDNEELVGTLQEREEAVEKLEELHKYLGLEFAPDEKEPVVRTAWPLFFFSDELTAQEDVIAFQLYLSQQQEKKIKQLRRKYREGEVKGLKELRKKKEQEARASDKRGPIMRRLGSSQLLAGGSSKSEAISKPKSWVDLASDEDWWLAKEMRHSEEELRADWEKMPPWAKRDYIPEKNREKPVVGDRLLSVDGQSLVEAMPLNSQQDVSMESDVPEYDHSGTYALLEAAGTGEVKVLGLRWIRVPSLPEGQTLNQVKNARLESQLIKGITDFSWEEFSAFELTEEVTRFSYVKVESQLFQPAPGPSKKSLEHMQKATTTLSNAKIEKLLDELRLKDLLAATSRGLETLDNHLEEKEDSTKITIAEHLGQVGLCVYFVEWKEPMNVSDAEAPREAGEKPGSRAQCSRILGRWISADGRSGSIWPFTCSPDAVVLTFRRGKSGEDGESSETRGLVDSIRAQGGATVAAGEEYTVVLYKGLAPWPMNTHWPMFNIQPRLLSPTIPGFVRSLTDPYELQYKYWEIIECARKIILVGLFIFFGQGSTVQLAVGLTVCVIFITLYHNIKPCTRI